MADEKKPPLDSILARALGAGGWSDDPMVRGERLRNWVARNWGDDRPCPYCGNVVWNVDPDPVAIPRLNSGAVVPAYLVLCDKCGQEVVLSADKVNLWPPPGWVPAYDEDDFR